MNPCCQSSARSWAQFTAALTAEPPRRNLIRAPACRTCACCLWLSAPLAAPIDHATNGRKCQMHDATYSDALLAGRSGRGGKHSALPHGAAVCRGRTLSVLAALLALAACAAPIGPVAVEPPDLTERLAAIAAPHQDLQTVRLRPEDGCYWYAHVGPVETTMLPLRTVDGRPICEPREIPALAAG